MTQSDHRSVSGSALKGTLLILQMKKLRLTVLLGNGVTWQEGGGAQSSQSPRGSLPPGVTCSGGGAGGGRPLSFQRKH